MIRRTGKAMGQISDSQFLLREATPADLDDITRIAQAGFPHDPEFDYRFPYRHLYPDDHWKWTWREYENYLNQPAKFVVLVVTAPVMRDGKLSHSPVALAVWDMAVLTEPTARDAGIYERQDANPLHMNEFTVSLNRGFDTHFAVYGKEQAHLWLLVTHPDFRGRGAGTMLCNWGKERAEERGWALTVLASPMGKRVYQRLAYSLVGSVIVQVDSEDERLEVYCLVRESCTA